MNIELFRNLFRGRDDVFAVRWEKSKRSGYMPAYSYDPYHYRLHKMNGGTFNTYAHKSQRPLSDQEIQKHLEGKQHIGVYPLLENNCTWFLVADFDGDSWKSDAITFLQTCEVNNIPAYLERSRSGAGGHVWVFFDEPYPAVKSRKLFLGLLESSGAFSQFDKSSSFDRVFPNQDYRSGKGLGNLIALPLFGPALEKSNCCFIDPEDFHPYEDQWNFLSMVQRVKTTHLDTLLQEVDDVNPEFHSQSRSERLTVILDHVVRIPSTGMNSALAGFLKEELNVANSEYYIKKKSGRSTYNTPRHFNLITESDDGISLPRGFVGDVIRFCREKNIPYDFIDKRKKHSKVDYNFGAPLQAHQNAVIEAVKKKDFGVIVAPPGAGKTVMGLRIIADKKQPALIVVHRRQLLDQWVERIEGFLGIPRKEVGVIGSGKKKAGNHITVASIQSLSKVDSSFFDKFGTIIVDECHRVPAKTFRETLQQFKSMYLYGLTATPFRKHSDGKLIFTFLGDKIVEIQPHQMAHHKPASVIVRETGLDVPYNSKVDPFEILSKILVHDSSRNKLIVKDVSTELNKGRKAVILTERKEHLAVLNLFLRRDFETITLSGNDSELDKRVKWKSLWEGSFQVVLTTGQYFGEGIDLKSVSTLFLVYPFSFQGKMIQYIGRVQRSEFNPVIYDYRDEKIDYLNRMFLKRNTYYRKIKQQATLFDEPAEEIQVSEEKRWTLDKKVKVAIEDLDFHYGGVAFSHKLDQIQNTLDFRVENQVIRPEFEVLKPYFSKMLKSQQISVALFAEFENGKLVSQSATSPDIDKINNKFIEEGRFRFVHQGLLKKIPRGEKFIYTADELQEREPLLDEDAILREVLRNGDYEHLPQVQFLADRHLGQILKIRFVVNPFSFLFLLEGAQNYYLVLETLDTREATYIWRIHGKILLESSLKSVEKDLETIKKTGRTSFLENPPDNFIRIFHDYLKPDKGVEAWQKEIENQLV